jgi:glucuronoarabinoxylan endo-1,4-beta-xylanase
MKFAALLAALFFAGLASAQSVTLTPTTELYGNVVFGSSSSSVTFTFTNGSLASATISSVANSSSGTGSQPTYFVISSNTCTGVVAVSATCTFIETFTPGSIGSFFTAAHVTYSGGDGAGGKQSVLYGYGTGASTINYTNVHQVIDGFGASTEGVGIPLTLSERNFFFNQLGLSIYRAGGTNGGQMGGNCATVSVSCAGAFAGDMAAQVAAGGKVYASFFSPPAIYTTNGSVDCAYGIGSGTLATAHFADYANWMANFVQSLSTYDSVSLYALSIQNEPTGCHTYDSSDFSAAQMDTFVGTNLGPTFTTDSISTLIFMPEAPNYTSLTSLAGTCMADSTCRGYLGGNNWHDYDAAFYAPLGGGVPYTQAGSQNLNPYSSYSLKYWQTEVSGCTTGCGPYAPGCSNGQWCPTIADALMWGAIIDNRIAVENANAWLYWVYEEAFEGTNSSLVYPGGTVSFPQPISIRAYVMGQYARFVRPGYSMIDATHIPQAGVTVSAYKNAGGTIAVIVATNQNATSASQTFTFTNTTVTAMTPYITSATLSMAQQSNVSLSSNSFSYLLPAYSVTTFVSPSLALAPSCTPVTGTYTAAQTVTCTNPNPGTTVMCYNTTGAPASNGDGATCPGGSTAYTTALSVPSTETLYIVAGTNALADSLATSNAYNIGSVTLTPTQQIFTTVNVGFSGPPYTFTLTNNGIASMTGLTLSVPPNYTLSGNTCGSTLAVSASCTVNVSFTPLAPANYLGGVLSATYSGGDSASPQVSSLDGAATLIPFSYTSGSYFSGMVKQ